MCWCLSMLTTTVQILPAASSRPNTKAQLSWAPWSLAYALVSLGTPCLGGAGRRRSPRLSQWPTSLSRLWVCFSFTVANRFCEETVSLIYLGRAFFFFFLAHFLINLDILPVFDAVPENRPQHALPTLHNGINFSLRYITLRVWTLKIFSSSILTFSSFHTLHHHYTCVSLILIF